MKINIFVLLFLIISFLTLLPVNAQTITDDCNSNQKSVYADYSNFYTWNYRKSSGWLNAPDDSVLYMQLTRQEAVAAYRISGASSVDIDIYSRVGTFVCGDISNPQSLNFGIANRSSLSQPKHPLWISKDSRGLYAGQDGCFYKVLLNQKTSQFDFVSTEIGTGINYGLSVFTTSDFKSVEQQDIKQTLVSTNNLSTDASVLGCFERYRVNIPKNTKYVGIVLNDFFELETTQGDILQRKTGNNICLAAVHFYGDNIITGSPVEPVPSSSSEIKKDNEKDKSKKEASASKAQSKSQSQQKARSSAPSKPSNTPPESSGHSQQELEETQNSDAEGQELFRQAAANQLHPEEHNIGKTVGAVMFIFGAAVLAWKIIDIFFLKNS